jgi:hypothetical protein
VDYDNNTIEYMHPMMLDVQANAEDSPTWEEAFNGPDQAGYWQAMQQVLESLESKDSWDTVDRKEWMNVLPSTWEFRCKRYPVGIACISRILQAIEKILKVVKRVLFANLFLLCYN